MSFFFPFRSQLQVIEDVQFKLRWLIHRYLQSDLETYESFIATNCFPANKWYKMDIIS